MLLPDASNRRRPLRAVLGFSQGLTESGTLYVACVGRDHAEEASGAGSEGAAEPYSQLQREAEERGGGPASKLLTCTGGVPPPASTEPA